MIFFSFLNDSQLEIQDTKWVSEFAEKSFIKMLLLLYMKLLWECFILKGEGECLR